MESGANPTEREQELADKKLKRARRILSDMLFEFDREGIVLDAKSHPDQGATFYYLSCRGEASGKEYKVDLGWMLPKR